MRLLSSRVAERITYTGESKMPNTNGEDPRIIGATRLRMARAAKRMNQTETADEANVILSKLSPDDRLSREIIRKYESLAPYQRLSENPARAIAIAEALDVEPTWLAPDMPLSPDGVARLKGVLADLVEVWPAAPVQQQPQPTKKTSRRGK